MSKKSSPEKETQQNEVSAVDASPAETAPADAFSSTEYVVADDFVGTDTYFTVNTTDESIYLYNPDAIYEG